VTTPPSRSILLHGRGHEWAAAIQTWLDRPVLGAGAGAYHLASARHQGAGASLYAHDLPLELAAELGVLGLLLGLGVYAAGAQLIYRAISSTGEGAVSTPGHRAVSTPDDRTVSTHGHRTSMAAWLLGPLVCAFLISNLLDWTWHLAGLGALWAVSAGALTGAEPSAKRGKEAQLG
jgi:O-antigen ligase